MSLSSQWRFGLKYTKNYMGKTNITIWERPISLYGKDQYADKSIECVKKSFFHWWNVYSMKGIKPL